MADEALKRTEAIGKLVDKPKVGWVRAADLLAIDPTAEHPIFISPQKLTLKTVLLSGSSFPAPAGDATIQVRRRGSATTTHTAVYSIIQPLLSSWTPYTLFSPDLLLEENDIVTVEVSKSGGGVSLPGLFFQFALEVP
jgi:hypothetical protein